MELTLHDRCDRDGAAALVVVKMNGTSQLLYFCGSCYNRNFAALSSITDVMVDNREFKLEETVSL